MSDSLGTYSFLPWLRQGIANSITAVDLDDNVKLRATIPVQLQLTGESVNGGAVTPLNVNKTVQLSSKPNPAIGSPTLNPITWHTSISTTKIFPGAIPPLHRILSVAVCAPGSCSWCWKKGWNLRRAPTSKTNRYRLSKCPMLTRSSRLPSNFGHGRMCM
jgi:hypothetical protein